MAGFFHGLKSAAILPGLAHAVGVVLCLSGTYFAAGVVAEGAGLRISEGSPVGIPDNRPELLSVAGGCLVAATLGWVVAQLARPDQPGPGRPLRKRLPWLAANVLLDWGVVGLLVWAITNVALRQVRSDVRPEYLVLARVAPWASAALLVAGGWLRRWTGGGEVRASPGAGPDR